VDFVSFNGLALNRYVQSITFVEVKSGRSKLSGVERSIQEAIESGKVSFDTVTHSVQNAFKIPMELPLQRNRNLKR